MPEKRYKKNYIFQMDKEKDKDIIEFMDNVKEEINLTTFFRIIIRDYMRKRKDANLEVIAERSDDGGIDKKIDQICIWKVLNSLDKLEKDIVVLRYYQELRIKDIAQIVNLPASTVRYKLKNAEKILKKRLEL